MELQIDTTNAQKISDKHITEVATLCEKASDLEEVVFSWIAEDRDLYIDQGKVDNQFLN